MVLNGGAGGIFFLLVLKRFFFQWNYDVGYWEQHDTLYSAVWACVPFLVPLLPVIRSLVSHILQIGRAHV